MVQLSTVECRQLFGHLKSNNLANYDLLQAVDGGINPEQGQVLGQLVVVVLQELVLLLGP